jgi:pimeloyl-ACP methyl ester carboxylesterase
MRAVLSTVLTLLLIAAGGFIVICAFLYFGQERSIFFPGPNDPQLRQQYSAQRVEIATTGAALEGWWIENPQATTPAVILYFGGNAEDVLHTATTAPSIGARSLLVVNYRGYGRSTGEPGQWAKQARVPALFLAAERDFVVPAEHTRRLFEAWAGEKQMHVLPQTGHNDLDMHPDYSRLIDQFLAAEK